MVSSDSLSKYYTCPAKWIFGCDSFLLSRFITFKHVIYCYREIEDPVRFFGSVQRQRSSSFQVQKQHTLRADFPALLDDENRDADKDSAIESLADSDEKELAEDHQENCGLYIEDDMIPVANKYTEFKTVIRRAIEIFEEQEGCGTTRFLDKFILDSTGISNFVYEIQQLKNQ